MADTIVINPLTNQITVEESPPITLVITTAAGTTSSPTSIGGLPINVNAPIANGDVLYVQNGRWINYPSDDFANGGSY